MTTINGAYKKWLTDLKEHIYSSQVKAALKVNAELLSLYWHLGNEILDKEKNTAWGKKLIDKLSKDLLHEFPMIKGFSRTNLYLVRQWVVFYTQKSSIVHPVGGQLPESGKVISKAIDNQPSEALFLIPWKHHKQIMSKCSSVPEALFISQKLQKTTGVAPYSCTE